jgi:competence protein ComEC
MTVYLKTHVLPQGRGDCIVLELPYDDGRQHLGFIDCYQFEILDEYLKANDLDDPDDIDFIVVTHPHWDHIGGILPLMEMYKDRIDNYWESGFKPGRSVALTHSSIIKLVENTPTIKFALPRAGDSFQFGSLDIRVLSPPDPLISSTSSDINNSSIVLRMTYGTATLLFAGDAQFGNWAHSFVSHQDHLSGRILKVSHHGSKHGTFLEALEKISPKIAVISGSNDIDDEAGEFPHVLTMNAINALPVEHVLCTNQHGYITIRSTANSWHWISHGQDPDLTTRSMQEYRA